MKENRTKCNEITIKKMVAENNFRYTIVYSLHVFSKGINNKLVIISLVLGIKPAFVNRTVQLIGLILHAAAHNWH